MSSQLALLAGTISTVSCRPCGDRTGRRQLDSRRARGLLRRGDRSSVRRGERRHVRPGGGRARRRLSRRARRGWSGARAGDRHGANRAAAVAARCAGPRDRPVGSDGRADAREAGREGIPVAIGDFATTQVGRSFPLVYLVFNTIVNLTTQDEQVACFENAAAHLAPRGAFVIEVGIPRSGGCGRARPSSSASTARAITASTSSTSRTRASSRTTSPPRATGSASGRFPSATSGPRSSI